MLLLCVVWVLCVYVQNALCVSIQNVPVCTGTTPAMLCHNGKMWESVLLVLVFLRVVGFPLSWKKLARGEVLQWVGYELLLSEASLGLSSSRAQWLEGWYTRLPRDRSVQMQEFQEELGRAAFVCGALDYDRPFLAPLCVFAARHAPASVKPLPLYVLVSLEYLRQKIRQRRHCECGLSRRSWSESTHTLTNTVWELVDGGPARINMASSPLLRRSIPGDCLTGMLSSALGALGVWSWTGTEPYQDDDSGHRFH